MFFLCVCCGCVKEFPGMFRCAAVWSSLELSIVLQPDGVWRCVFVRIALDLSGKTVCVCAQSKCSRANAEFELKEI